MFIKRFFPLLINSSFEDLFGLSLSFAHQLSTHFFFKRRKKITRLHFIFSSRFVFFFFSFQSNNLCSVHMFFFLMLKEAYVRQCFTTAKMLSFISMLRYTMVYGERKRQKKNAELWQNIAR